MLLYYVTDRKGFAGADADQCAALIRRIADAARAGVDCIQLREKDLITAKLELLAREALRVVRDNSATTRLLINTRADIALEVGADGVHLPANSPPTSEVRDNWLRHTSCEPLVGVSAHTIGDVERAESDGADFAVLAPVFEKVAAGTNGIGLNVLREACAGSRIPVLALGGVNLTNARSCLEAGAAGVAGIRLFQHGDVAETVIKLRAMPGLRT